MSLKFGLSLPQGWTQVILALWTQEEAVFEGKYYQVRGAIN
jgi:hypothetical protein